MEQAAALFKEAQLYEAMNEVYRLVMPIYEARRAYQSLEKVHRSLSDCYQQLLHKGSHRSVGKGLKLVYSVMNTSVNKKNLLGMVLSYTVRTFVFSCINLYTN